MAGAPTSEGGGNLLNGQTLLDGFGFLEGQLIGNAPMVFPGETDLFMALELVAEFGGAFGPIGQIVAFIAELIVMVLQLIDFLVGLFEGVPRAQKSIVVAHRFGTGYSLVSHMIAAQLYQLINDEGIVLSSSLPADQATFAAIRAQAEQMLVTIGADRVAAKHAIDEVWNNTTSGTEHLPKLLAQPMPAGWVLVGPKLIQQEYINHYNKAVQAGSTPKQAAKIATKWVFTHAPQKQLVKMKLYPQPGTNPCAPGLTWDPAAGQCIPSEPQLHPCPAGKIWNPATQRCEWIIPPTCPAGTQWDTTTQTCVPIVTPPPAQPCTPNPDGTGDTLTDGLDCVSQNLNVIQQQLAALQLALTGQGGAQLDPVTCTQLGNYVSALNVSIQAITAAITAAGGPANVTVNFDTAPLIAELEKIVAALTGAEPEQPIDLSHLNADADADVAARLLSEANSALVKAQLLADYATLSQGLQ